MADGAGPIGTVHLHHLPDRRGPRGVGLDRGNVGRRRQPGNAEQPLHHPHAPQHGRRGRAVGRHLQDRGLRQESAAGQTGGNLLLAEGRAAHALDAVELGQPLVDEDGVGVDQLADAEVLVEKPSEKAPRLGEHRVAEPGVEIGIESGIGSSEVDLAKLQPVVEKVLHEPVRFGIREHPLDLRREHLRPGERA